MGVKGVARIVSPDLLYVLAKMGHGDVIVFGDSGFPSSSICKNGPIEIRADGHSIPDLLKATLALLPLDEYVSSPVALMATVEKDRKAGLVFPEVWHTYQKLINESEGKEIGMEQVERFAFYERAKKAYAVIATGELVAYGNIILKKGLVKY